MNWTTGCGRLLDLASANHGVVTHTDIAACGIRRAEQDHLVALGVLRRVHRGVYACPGTQLSSWGEAMALSRACGANAVLSHSTAAAIHSFPLVPPSPWPEITVVGTRHPRPERAAVHRVARLAPADVEMRSGVAVTRAARTLVDIAARFKVEDLGRLVDEGVIARLWTIEALEHAIRRTGGRGKPGVANLTTLVASRREEPSWDSHLERKVCRILGPFGPFQVHYQLVLDGSLLILDIAWPDRKVAVEVDGFSVHGTSRTKFDRDRRHGNLLAAHGWRVARVTSAMTADEIVRVVGLLVGRDAA